VQRPEDTGLLDRLNKRVHVALPIRIICWDRENKPGVQVACTYDISPHGARVSGLPQIKEVGDIVAVERGRSGRAFCRVVWVGEENSELRGQIGIECVEPDRVLWETELAQMDEIFDRIPRGARPARNEFKMGGVETRRRRPRYHIEGMAELRNLASNYRGEEAEIKNLSELGCLITSPHALDPGTNLKLVLNVANYDLTVKGQVRHIAPEAGIGVEFCEIRKGDRPVMQFLMRKLAEEQFETAFELEI